MTDTLTRDNDLFCIIPKEPNPRDWIEAIYFKSIQDRINIQKYITGRELIRTEWSDSWAYYD